MPADTLDPTEARLRTTLRAVADQTDVGTPDEGRALAVPAVELDVVRGRRRGWWLAAAAAVIVLATATVAVTRIDRETSVQSAATSSPTATGVDNSPGLVATYVPDGFVAQRWQLGTGAPRQPVRMVVYGGDANNANCELAFFFPDAGAEDSLPTAMRPRPVNDTRLMITQVNGGELQMSQAGPVLRWTLPDGRPAFAVLAYPTYDPNVFSSTRPADNRALELLVAAATAVTPSGTPVGSIPMVSSDDIPGFHYRWKRPAIDNAFYGDAEAEYRGWRQELVGPGDARLYVQTIDRPYRQSDVEPFPNRDLHLFDTAAGFHFVADQWNDPSSGITSAVVYGGNDQLSIRIEGPTTLAELTKIAHGLRIDHSPAPITTALHANPSTQGPTTSAAVPTTAVTAPPSIMKGPPPTPTTAGGPPTTAVLPTTSVSPTTGAPPTTASPAMPTTTTR